MKDETEKYHFLIKLLPPRPSFAVDATEDERKLMKEHAVYWTGLMNSGIAIVFGPVMDPAGAWGMGVVEVSSEDQVRSLAAGDPAVSTGMLKNEIYPMQAVFRKESVTMDSKGD